MLKKQQFVLWPLVLGLSTYGQQASQSSDMKCTITVAAAANGDLPFFCCATTTCFEAF